MFYVLAEGKKKSLKINMFPIEEFIGKKLKWRKVEGMEEYDELENKKSEKINKHRIWFFEN